MKKFFTLVVLALLAVGCAKEYDDTGVRELIAGLDLRVSELEANVSALQSALGDGKFVRKVEEYKDPETGRTTGVTVTYTDGNIVHFNIVPADPTQGPVFSVIRNGAGELVWAVDGKAVKMDDEEIPVYQTPVFSIDEEGNLWVEVDGKKTNLGPVKSEGATLQDGIFTNLAVTDSAVVLTLSDNSVVNIPFAEAFQLLVEKEEYVFTAANPVVEIPYTVTAKTENTVVGAYYDIEKFGVKVEPEKLTVSQWAERFRILDESSNFSGKWSNDITPYLVGIMDAFNDPYIEEINLVKSTQLGGTEALLNMLGWIIMNDSVAVRRAIVQDDGVDTSNKQYFMNIPTLRTTLQSLPHPLKFIFADCCNVQNIEVAYELKDVTQYLIASPAPIPDKGAPYKTVIPDLFNHSDVQMYSQTCDDYYDLLESEDGHLPISVIKTSQLPLLAQVTKEVIRNIYQSERNINTDQLIYYYTTSSSDIKERIMYDMQDFVLRHAEPSDFQKWLNIYNQVVVYKKLSKHWQWHAYNSYTLYADFGEITEERFGGVSMFIPLERYENTKLKYNTLIKQTAWYQAVGWSELGW